MTTIVTRAGKGSALTHAEGDANFTNLNTDKAETSALAATDAALAAHLADAVDAHDASAISNVPAGNIAATTVQAAIDELDSEKQPLDATLTSLSSLGTTANKYPYTTGVDTWVEGDIDLAGRNILNGKGALVFDSKSSAVTYITANGIINNAQYLITSSDGGSFTGVTGASASTYADDSTSYCGTQFIPTGGNGSSALVRKQKGGVYADWFGASPSASAAANSIAIQEALDSLSNGGELDFGQEGTYQHDTGLTWVQTSTSATNPGITIKGLGRRTTIVQYTGTTGYGWTIKGTALDLTRAGLIEGVTIRDIGLKGATRAAANTESGVYVQAFNHFNLDNALISDYGQDGIHLDRLYYNLAPDAGIDDRGAFVHLKDSEISLCGRYDIVAGGINSATDYSIDHLVTENMHVTTAGNTAMKAYVNNWTDLQSLFYGDAIGVELYAQNTDILTQNVTMIGTRFEGGQSDCMLKVISCKNLVLINPFFAGHSGPLPVTQVKIATSASYNVGNVEFINPIFQQATTAINIDGTGGVTNVLVRDPTYSTITTEIANANSKPVQQIKGGAYERVTGGGAPIQLTGVAGVAISAKLSSDSNTCWYFDNSTKRHYMGNGTAVADVYFNRSALAPANGHAFSGPVAVSGTVVGMMAGSGTPEGAVTAPVGWLYLRTDGGASTTLYVKESGTGNTGWVAK